MSISVSAHLWGLGSFPADRHQHVVVLIRARRCRGGTACHGNPSSVLPILPRGTVKLVIAPTNHRCLKHTQTHHLSPEISCLLFSFHIIILWPSAQESLFQRAPFDNFNLPQIPTNHSEPAGKSGCLFSMVLLLCVSLRSFRKRELQ